MKKLLMKGNEVLAEAAVQSGCMFYAGYPITPQNEIPEYMSRRMPEAGGVFIQAESELAAINMVFGAAACGTRAMTSSSGPGISLMQEGLSFLAGAELPAVIANIQRGGPGLGNISSSQADYFQAVKGGGHGDYRLLVLAPYNLQEIWDLTMRAFDKADEYRNPVMLLTDAILGQMMEPFSPVPYRRPLLPAKNWALGGCKGREPNVIKSLFVGEGQLEKKNYDLQAKYAEMSVRETLFECHFTDDAELILVAYGIAARVSLAAIRTLRQAGRRVGLLRPITLFPFPSAILQTLTVRTGRFLVVELNAGQMIEDVRLSTDGAAEVLFYGKPGGAIITPEDLSEHIASVM